MDDSPMKAVIEGNRIIRFPFDLESLSVQTVTLTVDGRVIEARESEPIATALLANGIRVFRTMPKTGEARGGYCMVGRCSDCLMEVDGELNVRACMTPVRDEMVIKIQRGLGTINREIEP
ncbi:MAG: (2Fe-2S)-binding protein [Thermomicrobiales bacterium]